MMNSIYIRKYFCSIVMLVGLNLVIPSSFAQNQFLRRGDSQLERESFICATGNYSMKVVNGKIEPLLNEFTEVNNNLISLSLPPGLEDFKNVKSISSGVDHIVVLTSKGEVYTKGSNTSGQLGYLTTSNEQKFLKVKGLPKIKEVHAGSYHCLALDFKGNVYTWGNNTSGQLGNGTILNNYHPVKVKELKHIVSVDAGTDHNLALDKDSLVWSWGNNSSGQIGDGTLEAKVTPVRINTLNGIVNIKASVASYALKADGTLWSWGHNGYGQLGNGNTINSNLPNFISSLPPIINLNCGLGHVIAMDYMGSVWTWGNNSHGQLGDGSVESRNFPLKIISECTDISSGNYHSLILNTDCTILGTGTVINPEIGDEEISGIGYLFSVEKLFYKEDTVEVIIISE